MISFLSATLLPGGSEVFFIYLLEEKWCPWILIIVASSGNTIGSVVNYMIGKFSIIILQKKGFGISNKKLEKGKALIGKWGDIALFFSFLPIVGDPITGAAGVIRYPFLRFLIFVATGKLLRYTVVYFTYWKVINPNAAAKIETLSCVYFTYWKVIN